MTTATVEVNHAQENAKAWYESIIEMTDNLDRDSAIDAYAANLSRVECEKMLEEVSISSSDSEPTEDLREAVAENIKDGTIEPDNFEFDEDEARQTIQESILSVQVRSDWVTPGEEMQAAEFEVLLTTGGPALRIIGELDEYKQPDRAWMEYQDWGTPWTQYFPANPDTLLTFCREFYFGE